MPNLSSKIETLLFIAAKPLTIKKIAELTKKETAEVTAALAELDQSYVERGLEIKRLGDKVQMMTSSDNRKLAEEFVKDEITGELSRPSLETLTIVAYRGPVVKAELEMIRGVNCSLILRNLMIRGLVEEIEDPKRGTLYQVTFDFLKFLGINQVNELADYEKLNNNENLQKLLNSLNSEAKDEAAGPSAKLVDELVNEGVVEKLDDDEDGDDDSEDEAE